MRPTRIATALPAHPRPAALQAAAARSRQAPTAVPIRQPTARVRKPTPTAPRQQRHATAAAANAWEARASPRGPRHPGRLDTEMTRRSAILLIGVTLAVTAEARPQRGGTENGGCTVTRILPDGRRVAAAMPPGIGGEAFVRQGPHFSAARSSSRASGRSAVSASSSSSSSSSSTSSNGGRSFARSSSSYTDDAGRTITTMRDGRGCTVTIDERTRGEE